MPVMLPTTEVTLSDGRAVTVTNSVSRRAAVARLVAGEESPEYQSIALLEGLASLVASGVIGGLTSDEVEALSHADSSLLVLAISDHLFGDPAAVVAAKQMAAPDPTTLAQPEPPEAS